MKIKHPLITPLVLVSNDEYWLPYVLESTRGYFERYVIYDVGSSDGTIGIIKWFIDSMQNKAEFFVRGIRGIPAPSTQGAFRNSMIAEARSEWTFILDGDEIYSPKSYENILNGVNSMNKTFKDYEPLYGIVPRIEVAGNLNSAYGTDKTVPHHRLYHRTAVFTGPHPGEVPLYEQNSENSRWIRNAVCYHFHNADRSTRDSEVPKRLDRKTRPTYRPGSLDSVNIFEVLPILKSPIEDFPVNPRLKELQGGYAK